MVNCYGDMNDNVNSQNGAWMTSWLSDHTEKLRLSIPDNDKDSVKISTWLLILFLRYHGDKIRREIVCVYFIQKQFLTRGNLSCWQIKVICFIFWHENLTTFPTSDRKLEIAFPIAHSHSYNILNLGRKWSYNNRDTAQRSLPCRFMFGKKWLPIDITRKYDKLCIVAFNW